MRTSWNIHEKTVVVTGGTKGIGYETARELAARGATVITVGRDATRGADAVASIQHQTGKTTESFLQADLSNLAEVRRLAAHSVHVAVRWLLWSDALAAVSQRLSRVKSERIKR